MQEAGDSATPEVMYGWRVKALKDWMASVGKVGGITIEDFARAGHLDQYHYLGLEANQDIIDLLQLNKDKKVLDVGSGIGGPARYDEL